MKKLEAALREMKEEGIAKKEDACAEEFATLAAASEAMSLFVKLANNPLAQTDPIEDFENYEGKQRIGTVSFSGYFG